MKIEIGNDRPAHFKEFWPGQYDVFHHLEYVCGIPSVLFAITTNKANGKPNINFHAWSSFQGDGGGFFAILGGVYQHTHTYANVMRDGEFCVNFLSSAYYDKLIDTVKLADDADEFAECGFTVEKAKTISTHRIAESFLSLECKRESVLDLSGSGKSALIIGRVHNAAIDGEYSRGFVKKYGDDGFMLNIHGPINVATGGENVTGLSLCNVIRTFGG